jgi:hypothetical protein
MQTQLTPRNIETQDALCRFTGRLLAELQTRRRPGRMAFPLPRREACLTRRAKIAAMREAELTDWLNDDDDFASAMHQPVA